MVNSVSHLPLDKELIVHNEQGNGWAPESVCMLWRTQKTSAPAKKQTLTAQSPQPHHYIDSAIESWVGAEGARERERDRNRDKEEERNPKYYRWSKIRDDNTFITATYGTHRPCRTGLMWLQFLSAIVFYVDFFYLHCCSLIFTISVAAPLVAFLIGNSKFPIDIYSSKNCIRYLYHHHLQCEKLSWHILWIWTMNSIKKSAIWISSDGYKPHDSTHEDAGNVKVKR